MDLAEKEFEALQAEKRDKLNSRLPIWSVLISLAGAGAFASLQTGSVSYSVAMFPVLAACLARFSGHNEDVLDQIKAYLLQLEEKNQYQGYEKFNKLNKRKSSGGHKKALRDAILAIDLLVLALLGVHLFTDNLIPAIVAIVLVEGIAMYKTCTWLRD